VTTGLSLLLVLALLLPAAPLRAQEAPPAQPAPTPWVVAADGGAQLGWDANSTLSAAGVSPASLSGDGVAAALGAAFPRLRYQGYDLPMQLVTLRIPPGAQPAVALRGLQAVDLPAGAIVPGAPDLPPVIVEEGQPEPESRELIALPSAPAFVVRSGMVGDNAFVVIALSPIYSEGGQARFATALDAFVPGAAPLDGPLWQYTLKPEPDPIFAEALAAASDDPALAAEAASLNAAVDAAVAAMAPPAIIEGSTLDPAALDASDTRVFVIVDKPGLQSITRAALTAQNGAYDSAPLSSLQITRKGVKVPVHVIGANEIRFYVESVGDRWNSTDVHVVTINAADPSPFMGGRVVTPATPGEASRVFERGLWVKNVGGVFGYTPQHAGADGDRYFSGRVVYPPNPNRPEENSVVATLTAAGGLQFGATLPPATGPSTYTFALSPVQVRQGASPTSYTLNVKLDSTNVSLPVGPFPYTPTGTWPDFNTTATLPTNERPTTLTISHGPTAAPSAVLIDSISMVRPVRLNLGGAGARFQTAPGQTELRWQNTPTAAVYDVTDPAAPIYLTGAKADTGFVDTLAERRYLVPGSGSSHQPALRKPVPFAFAGVPKANALYIVPASESPLAPNGYTLALKPLLDLRNRQGYRTAVVNVQALYDAYSYGWSDAFAIRRFLQQAYTAPTWRDANNRPILRSAVLVGDGTVDPKNFEGKGKNLQLIPPFIAQGVDPWLGEAACDPCYGQLTDPDPNLYPTLGENPHLGDDPVHGQWFSAEVWIGRFPVNSASELTSVVAKLVQYESVSTPYYAGRSRILYVTDNTYKTEGLKEDDRITGRDPAGNFEAVSNEVRHLNPAAIGSDGGGMAPRIYYAPFPQRPVDTEIGAWRVSNADNLLPAMKREIEGAGVAVLLYNGHANHFNMGTTEVPGAAGRRSVIEFNDIFSLSNSDKLFAMLTMTCEAAQFTKPTDSGTAVAERFFIDTDGSAMAVWGPTGQSTASSHDALQTGFFERLFAARGAYLRMGELTDAGFQEVLFQAPVNSYVLRTFVFFGDPLTRLRYDQLDRQLQVPTVFGVPGTGAASN
jgi:hypothetical protein